jgi:hypothetical protein
MEEVVRLHSLRHERHDQRRDGDARGDLHEQVLPELKYENHGTEDSGERMEIDKVKRRRFSGHLH